MDLQEETTIVLRKALTQDGGKIAELHLREPTVRELDKFMKDIDKHGAITAMSLLISTISGLQKPTIDHMGARDFKDAQNYLASFLEFGGSSPETGEAK